ncbi:MAG TPA: FHA domain-containing protein [Solirubrobacterales bacterium]|nr:FHA domain-containing protein [Solirubrobacterales bacterium]
MPPLVHSDRIDQPKAPERTDITASLTPTPASDSYATGTFPGPGTYFCVECGSQLSLLEDDRLPPCSRCGASSFRLDSIFESMQEHGATTAEFEVQAEVAPLRWLEELKAELPPGSRHLACRDDSGEVLDFEIETGWTRIGRSVTANIRLDHPSVSRRHALIVSESGESLRVLDDRSLNGVMINGDLVEWGKLADGDELAIGRYRLFALEG